MQVNVTNFSRAQTEHKKLLYNLKETVETLFLNYKTDNSWTNPDGLLRLHTCIEQIFANGIRIYKQDDSPDYWHFIEGLNWLNPSMTISIGNNCYNLSSNVHIPFARIKHDKALSWIYTNLESHKLSNKLKYLVSDTEHLNSCYEVNAFLQNERYLGALFICLKALEENQANLLSQIDSALINEQKLLNHKRSTSHPDFSFVPAELATASTTKPVATGQTVPSMGNAILLSCKVCGEENDQAYFHNCSVSLYNSKDEIQIKTVSPVASPCNQKDGSNQRLLKKRKKSKKHIRTEGNKQFISLKLRPWSSLPDLRCGSVPQKNRRMTISQPIHIPYQKIRLTAKALASITEINNKVPLGKFEQSIETSISSQHTPKTVLSSAGSSSTDLMPISLIRCDDIEIHFDRKYAAQLLPKGKEQTPASVCSDTVEPASPPKRLLSRFPKKIKLNLMPSMDKIETGSLFSSFAAGSTGTSAPGDFVNAFVPLEGRKIQNRYNRHKAMDDSVLAATSFSSSTSTSGNYLRPSQGQSLTSFLQAAQFSRAANTNDLERENAHFSMSEAMISAIEQIKWQKIQKSLLKKSSGANGETDGASGITVNENKRKRRLRMPNWDVESSVQHNQDPSKAPEQKDAFAISSESSTSDDDSDVSDKSHYSENDSSSDMAQGDLSYLKGLSVSTHSINDHTAYAEWGENMLDTLSAESVALSLISKFSDKQLPRACDLIWLVSEQDAPQQMLPMPGSWTVNPDEVYKIPFTRGTRDWAPPRSQIIFTRHAPVARKLLLHKQNYRCAGCGMRVAVDYSHRFRYCDYLGKFHCTGCHHNQISIIPARVLDRWNFKSYPVSVFAYRLMDEIWTYPLFRVSDLNTELYKKTRPLQLAKMKRDQLKFIQDFIVSCRFAENAKSIFNGLTSHITTDTDNWAMCDFVAVRNGSFVRDINEIIEKCESHIFACELCMARGFICELCPKKQVIFPWQPNIKRCSNCGVIVHEKCWKEECAKCNRIKKRQPTKIPSISSAKVKQNKPQ